MREKTLARALWVIAHSPRAQSERFGAKSIFSAFFFRKSRVCTRKHSSFRCRSRTAFAGRDPEREWSCRAFGALQVGSQKIFGPIAKIRSINQQISRPESVTRRATAQNFKQGTCPHAATAKTALAMCCGKVDFDWGRFAQNAPNGNTRKSTFDFRR